MRELEEGWGKDVEERELGDGNGRREGERE